MNGSVIKPWCLLILCGAIWSPMVCAGFAVAQPQSGNIVYSGNQMTPVPRFMNKSKAIELEQSSGDRVRIAYNIGHGSAKSLGNVPDTNYFYFNPYSQIISAAVTSQDAIDLAQVIPQVFFAEKDDTLSSSLKRWANEAGYQLNWNSDYDYNIQFSYSFHGALTAEDGPLDQILKSFENNAVSLDAEVMGNKVIVVKDKKFKPSAVIGY